jgi:hypothetical protein
VRGEAVGAQHADRVFKHAVGQQESAGYRRTGNPGPQVTQDGTCFVAVSVSIDSESLSSTVLGDCPIAPSNFNPGSPRFDHLPNWPLVVTPLNGGGPYEFSAIIIVSGGASSTNPLTPGPRMLRAASNKQHPGCQRHVVDLTRQRK